jgi:monoamine oxidase
MKISRREFVIGSGLLGIASVKTSFSQSKRRVLIAGAGLSGLSAAYELSLKGFDVTVMEGRERIGGRVSTLRKPFEGGQYAELGGEIVGDGYKRLLGYANKFGIKYEEIPDTTDTGGSIGNVTKGLGNSVYLKGKLYPIGSDFPNPYNFKGEEATALPQAIYSKYIRLMANEVRDNPAKLQLFDRMTLGEALRDRGVSDEMIRLINVSLNYNSIETVSVGGILWESRRRSSVGTKAIKIIGGNDQIPQQLYENASKNGVKFLLNSKIKQISYSDNLVKVFFTDSSGKEQIAESDSLVCTIPFSVLREIKFSPALPEPKAKAIAELAYTRITKIYLQGKRQPWDERKLGSSVWTDSSCERIFNVAGSTDDENGIFSIWNDGDATKAVDLMSDKDREKWGRKEFEKVLSFMKIKKSSTKSWANDEFVRGAYSHFTRGQLKDLQPYLKTSVATIHFGGEHTAERAPGMEGALESAERVVAELS